MLHTTQTVAVHAVVPLLASWYFYSQPHYLALFFGLLELGLKETTPGGYGREHQTQIGEQREINTTATS